MQHEVYVGLGSNLEHPLLQLWRALLALERSQSLILQAVSSFYYSAPWGNVKDQPDFVNAVVKLSTTLTPFELLQTLQQIEKQQNRQRGAERWAARTLDLDILLFGPLRLNSPQLTIPHRYLIEREFVVYPLYEIAPALLLPEGEQLAAVVARLPKRGMQKIDENGNLSRDF